MPRPPSRDRRVHSDEFAYADEERFEVLKPHVTVQVEGKPHKWPTNICSECGVSPDRAEYWCTNEAIRALFGYKPRAILVVPTNVVSANRLWALDRRALVTEAAFLHIATVDRTDQELRRAIYICRALGKVPAAKWFR